MLGDGQRFRVLLAVVDDFMSERLMLAVDTGLCVANGRPASRRQRG
jgi:hypothetical protein